MEKTDRAPMITELADQFVALEFELTDSIPDECRRLHRQHEVCVQLTALCGWSEAGPHIDASVKRARQMLRTKTMAERIKRGAPHKP